MKHLKIGCMAFWSNTHFPYILGGTITKIRPEKGDGTYLPAGVSVETKEFGIGYGFVPKFCLPIRDGKKLKASLARLEATETSAVQAVREGFNLMAQKVLDSYETGYQLK